MDGGFLRSQKCAAWVFALAFVAGAARGQDTASQFASVAGARDTPRAASQPVSSTTAAPKAMGDYIIGESDLLMINVWKEKEISQELPVRPDGKISLPLLGDIEASGRTPTQLQQFIADKLKSYLQNPQVTVIVKDPRSHQYNVVGQVVRPGSYPLLENITVLDALAACGGFQDFAKKTKIYVLRPAPGGGRVPIPFNFKEVILGRNTGQNVLLKPGDTIVVP